MEKMIYNKFDVLKTLAILLLVCVPSKTFSLFFLALFIAYKLAMNKTLSRAKIIFIFIFFINALFSITYNGFGHLANYFLFVIFISPLVLMLFFEPQPSIITNESRVAKKNKLKKAIEYFLIVQILFSVAAILYRGLSSGFKLDVNFGDAVAGTFRWPFSYSIDSANVVFAFTMILVLLFYRFQFKKEINKLIFISSCVIVFISSVNHLFICIVIAVVIASVRPSKILVNLIVLLFLLYLFSIISPTNFKIITERIGLIFSFGNGADSLSDNLKIQYIATFFDDLILEPIKFILTGTGCGNYSSRAALFFTGEYVNNFNFVKMSLYTENNTYPLLIELKNRPHFLQGSFHYPYNSIITFFAELGIIPAMYFLYSWIKKIFNSTGFKFSENLILISFILLASIVDNYLEYYQAMFVIYFLIKKKREFNCYET
ncbi:hypothetical protein N9528_00035 [Crocinitomicaceae bacterium]|nr:hypothetical protein [Crocinitomicaceae bacterium]